MNKQARERRSRKTKFIIKKQGAPRIVVFRSSKHIYAQIVDGSEIKASSSTQDKGIKTKLKSKKIDQAHQIGKILAERATKKSIKNVAFDRCGYNYHGRVKAIADGAREGGLVF